MNPARFVTLACLLCARLGARDYCISPSGNDTSAGTAASPWKSALPLEKAALGPGDRVFFLGGFTYTAGVSLLKVSGAPGKPIVISSYGKGRATLAPSDKAQNALKLRNCSHVAVSNLAFAGAGRDQSEASGILLLNDSGPNSEGISIDRCEIWGFNPAGLWIEAKGSHGLSDLKVTRSWLHHNRDMGAHSTADWKLIPRPHKNLYFGHCRVYSNWGKVDSKNNMGGIVLMGVSGALLEHNETYDNGGDLPYGGGVFGIWCWSADHVVMQFNESHHNRQNGKSSDGGGFDLDGATTDSIVQYNYSHDNDGAGVLLAQFATANESGPFKNNIVRYNISSHDAQRGSYGGITVWGASPQDKIGRSEIYGNTVVVVPPTRGGVNSAFQFLDNNFKDISVYNNIFVCAPGIRFIDMKAGGDRESVHFSHNDYWTEGGGFKLIWDGKNYASLKSWTGIGAGHQEAGGTGLNLDPQLKNRKLSPTSPLRDKGLDLSKLKDMIADPGKRDYFGGAVPYGQGWDIGAHEFTPASSAP